MNANDIISRLETIFAEEAQNGTPMTEIPVCESVNFINNVAQHTYQCVKVPTQLVFRGIKEGTLSSLLVELAEQP
jgi:hypothetical protein